MSIFTQVLICVDDLYIRKLACEATELHAMGLKLPYSLISTAPKEFQEQPITGKLSKNQKKKMKKKAKRQTELIKKQLEHIQQLDAMPDKVDKSDELPKNGGGPVDQQNNDDADDDDNTPDGPPSSNEISQTGNEIVNGTQKAEVSVTVDCAIVESIFTVNCIHSQMVSFYGRVNHFYLDIVIHICEHISSRVCILNCFIQGQIEKKFA